jgi:hypothetical protein
MLAFMRGVPEISNVLPLQIKKCWLPLFISFNNFFYCSKFDFILRSTILASRFSYRIRFAAGARELQKQSTPRV